MVQGNRTVKNLARQKMSEDPNITYSEAVEQVKTANSVKDDFPKVGEAIVIGGDEKSSLRKYIEVVKGSVENDDLNWGNLVSNLGDEWKAIMDGHFGAFHIGKPVEGHAFGFRIVGELSVYDTLDLDRTLGSERIAVTFPVDTEPEDLLGTGEEFYGQWYSEAIDPQGKTTEEFLNEIEVVAKEFANAHTQKRMPSMKLLNAGELLYAAELHSALDSVSKGEMEESDVKALQTEVEEARELGSATSDYLYSMAERVRNIPLKK